jgi:hypothetical protein
VRQVDEHEVVGEVGARGHAHTRAGLGQVADHALAGEVLPEHDAPAEQHALARTSPGVVRFLNG